MTLISLFGRVALAQEPGSVPAGPTLADDPLLAGLVKEALERRPELAQARATIQADLARVPQASALPDPVLSLGIQNDGFSAIRIGEMETSYLTVMASQTFPWYGKRDLRGDVVTLGARQAEADLKRARLSVEAEVERTYVDLLLVRDQLGLLAKLETLWTQAESMARARYESGDGAQSDILRAQLERSRLKQRRFALEAEERRRVAVLNRLRGRPLDEAIATSRSLVDVPDPALPDGTTATKDAEARSPELKRSQLAVEQSGRLVDLAKKDYFPDLTVSAGVMPRWGKFDPMWQAGLSFSIPIWSGDKQSREVEENRMRGTAAHYGADATRQLLRQRVAERLTLLEALVETNRLYRSGLLVQSEATVASTMAQYEVGRATFASVLEALTGYVADISAFYESIAAAQRIDIAEREVSLDSEAGPAPTSQPQPTGTAGSESASRM
ncbi:MAG: TolC family protein [Deltaproteobacteria bacterium]|nr:TolC family protein [Deltaproteobacteria bacterium]